MVFCIEPVGTPTVRPMNVMKKTNMMAVWTADSKYSRHTLFGGPNGRGAASGASGSSPASFTLFLRAIPSIVKRKS
jgi:hypothetical protein